MSLSRRRALRATIAALAAATIAAGCGGPLAVTAVTSRTGQVKFGYTQIGTGRQGIISCTVGPNGDAENCRNLSIVFNEKRGGAR